MVRCLGCQTFISNVRSFCFLYKKLYSTLTLSILAYKWVVVWLLDKGKENAWFNVWAGGGLVTTITPTCTWTVKPLDSDHVRKDNDNVRKGCRLGEVVTYERS